MQKIMAVVEEMYKTFSLFHELDRKGVEENFRKVFEYERQADEVKRSILDELSKGVFHPINREEIIRLIMTADDIAAHAKASTRKLNFIPPEKLTENLREAMKTFAVNLVKITEGVNNAFNALEHDPKMAIQASQKVETMEEKIDDFRIESVIPEFLLWCSKSKDVGLCLLLKETLDGMENCADRCEDLADVIRDIALSYL